MASSLLAIGPFGIFLGSVARRWSVAARPITQAQHHCCCQDVWVGKGNAAGRYKHTQVRGLGRMGLLILQRSLVLVVTATLSPLQKP